MSNYELQDLTNDLTHQTTTMTELDVRLRTDTEVFQTVDETRNSIISFIDKDKHPSILLQSNESHQPEIKVNVEQPHYPEIKVDVEQHHEKMGQFKQMDSTVERVHEEVIQIEQNKPFTHFKEKINKPCCNLEHLHTENCFVPTNPKVDRHKKYSEISLWQKILCPVCTVRMHEGRCNCNASLACFLGPFYTVFCWEPNVQGIHTGHYLPPEHYVH